MNPQHAQKPLFLRLMAFHAVILTAAASLSTRAQGVEMKPDPKLLKQVATCKASGKADAAPILILKLWHPAPSLNTRNAPPSQPPPQAENLREIEKQTGEWIESKKIKTVVAEGCEGKFDDYTTFYGWSLIDLRNKLKSDEFEKIVTHPAQKLEARYGDQVETVCGDNKKATDEELLAFSDARAAAGYLSRIVENSNNLGKQRIYLEGAMDAFKIRNDSKPEQVIAQLKKELQKEVAHIRALNLKRSESLAAAAMGAKNHPTAVVAGGTHAQEILQKLEEKHRDCIVLEPVHYAQDEEKLLADLERLLK